MRKDPTEFRERFLRWKKGELVYENGLALPAYKDGKISDKLYINIMEKVAADNYKLWGFENEDLALLHALNDNTYNYRGYYNKYPNGQGNAIDHWTDEFKTVWHPTFSDESIYSGKKSQYNPNGLKGGHWEYGLFGEKFIPAKWQRKPKYEDGKSPRKLEYHPEGDYYYGGKVFPGKELVVTGVNKKQRPYWVTAKTKQLTGTDVLNAANAATAFLFDDGVQAIKAGDVHGLVKFADPTGIMHYPDAYEEIKNFVNNPSIATGISGTLGITSALPLVGNRIKGVGKLGLKMNIALKPGEYLSKPGRYALDKVVPSFTDAAMLVLPKGIKRPNLTNVIQNTATTGARLYEDLPFQDTAYMFMRNSGGSTDINFLDQGVYTGSYKWPESTDRRSLNASSFENKGKSVYGGENANLDRDLVKLYLYGNSPGFNIIQKNDTIKTGDKTVVGDSYEGHMLPTKTDSSAYNIPINMKAELDSMIQNNRYYPVNINGLKNPNIKMFKELYLDNVRHANLKPVRRGDKYFLKASKIWDFGGTTGIFGDMIENKTRRLGIKPIILKQEIPLNFVKDVRTDEGVLLKDLISNPDRYGYDN